MLEALLLITFLLLLVTVPIVQSLSNAAATRTMYTDIAASAQRRIRRRGNPGGGQLLGQELGELQSSSSASASCSSNRQPSSGHTIECTHVQAGRWRAGHDHEVLLGRHGGRGVFGDAHIRASWCSAMSRSARCSR